MDQLQKQILLLFSIPIYAVIIPLEILLSNFRRQKFYSWKETFVNIYLNILNAGIDLLLRLFIAFALLTYLFQYHLLINWNPIIYWIILLFGEDLLFWTEHFVDHSVRLFWAVHVTHHSSPEYNLSTGFRSSVFMPVYKYLYFSPLVLLNFQADGCDIHVFRHPDIRYTCTYTSYKKTPPLDRIYICNPITSPGTPRQQYPLPRQEHGHDVHYLGSYFRYIYRRNAR